MGQLNRFECEYCGMTSEQFKDGRRSRKKSLIPYYKGVCPYCNREGGIKEICVGMYEEVNSACRH